MIRQIRLMTLLVAFLMIPAAIAGEPLQQASLEALSGRLTVHNKGIGGQNTEQGKARFEADVVALKPDYVFIYFGLNDTLNEPRFLPLDTFIANLVWMVDRARTAGIKPVLCTIHRVTEEPLLKRHRRESYGSEGPNGKIARYNAAIRQLAKEKDVPLADFAAVVQRNPVRRFRRRRASDRRRLAPAGAVFLRHHRARTSGPQDHRLPGRQCDVGRRPERRGNRRRGNVPCVPQADPTGGNTQRRTAAGSQPDVPHPVAWLSRAVHGPHFPPPACSPGG